MRVLFFCPTIPDLPEWRTPAFSRSGNLFVLGLLNALHADGLTLETVESYVPRPAWPRGELWSRGGAVQLLPGIPAHLHRYLNLPVVKVLWLSVRAAWRIVSWRPPDRSEALVLCYNLSVPNALFIRAACWLARKPLVFSVADINIPGETIPRTLSTLMDWTQHRWVLPRCEGLLVVSEAISTELAPNVPYLVAPGGISSERADALRSAVENDALRRDAGHKFCVLLSGGLEDVNGVNEFISAARTVAPDIEFWVAGTGQLDPLVIEAAKELPNVRFFGFVDQDTLFSLIRTADMVVNMRIRRRLHSRFFFPGKFFEFLASGTLTASTDVGPTMRQFDDVMIRIEDDTADGLMDAIHRAQEMPRADRLIMAERARERIVERYSWGALGVQVHAFLRGLVEASSRVTTLNLQDPHQDDTAHGIR